MAFRTKKIKTSILVAFIIFSAILISLIGLSLFYIGKKAIAKNTFDKIASIRDIKKNQIEEFFKDRILETEIISKSLDITNLLKENFDSSTVTKIDIPIIKLLAKKEFAKKIHLKKCTEKQSYSVDLTQTPNLHITKMDKNDPICLMWEQCENITEPFISDLIDEGNNIFSIIIVSPVYTLRNEKLGMIALEVSQEKINQLMLNNSPIEGAGLSENIYLLGFDLLLRSQGKFEKNGVMNRKINSLSASKINKKEKGEHIIYDYRNIKVFSAYSPIKAANLNWGIIVEIDQDIAMLQFNKFRFAFIFTIVFTLIAVIVFAYLLTRIVVSPIQKLDNIIQMIDFDSYKPIRVKRKDEIGNLFHSLNKMVAEIKTHRDEIQEREIRLNHFYEATTDGILLHEDKKIILINKALSDITGFSEEELMKLNARSLYISKNLFNKNNKTYETLAFRKNKKPIAAEIQHNIINYQGKKIDVCLIRDISKHKEVQNKLKKSEDKFQSLIETLNEGVLRLDESFTIQYANPKACELLGHSPKEIIGKSFVEYISTEDLVKFNHLIKTNEQKKRNDFQINLIRQEGSRFHARLSFNPIFNETKDFKGLIVALSDVTKQVEAQESLKKSEDQLYAVFNYSPIMNFLINDNLNILTMNKAAMKLSPKRVEKRLGNIFNCINALSMENGCGHHLECKNCKIRNAISYTFKTKLGIHKLEAKLTVLGDKGKQTSHFVISTSLLTSLSDSVLLLSIDDITNRKITEKKLLDATISVEEKERKRFAQDLHDELGPFLSGIKLFISKIGDANLSNTEREDIVSELEELIDEAIIKTRSISNKLMPSVLEDFGLIGGLDSFVSKINQTNKVQIQYNASPTFNTIDEETQVILYRVIIELINNTLKHAEANSISIKLEYIDQMLLIKYSDDGKGFNFDQIMNEKKGLGLLNIINRLKNIDAEYTFYTQPDKGLIVEIEISYQLKN